MSKKSRYFLIALCIIIFSGLAPVIVFYVRGVSYDSSENTYLHTGILSVRSDPKGARASLDDKPASTTPLDIRFLKPGGYNLTLTKDGYLPWSKRIQIAAGLVTWASPEAGKIVLFLKTPQTANIADGVLDFSKLSQGWLYLTQSNLVVTSDNSGNTAQLITLPKPVEKITASPDGSFFLLEKNDTKLLFDLKNKTFTDLSLTLKTQVSEQFDNENNIWALRQSSLVFLSNGSQKETIAANGVSAFTIKNDNVYFLQKNEKNGFASLLFFNAQNIGAGQLLANTVPLGTRAQLLVTEQKEIFALEDGNLYTINGDYKKLASDIADWNYDPDSHSLIFTTSSELDSYDFSTRQVQLITRSSDNFINPVLRSDLGFSFYIQNGSLIAAETDTTDHQNIYTLATLGPGSKFTTDSAAKKIYLLNNGRLQMITVR